MRNEKFLPQAVCWQPKSKRVCEIRASSGTVAGVSGRRVVSAQAENRGVKAHSLELVLAARVLQELDERLAGSGITASQWYAELPVPGQGQLREFYLAAIEAVDPGLREKYAKIYRNY